MTNIDIKIRLGMFSFYEYCLVFFFGIQKSILI